jgi:hypothetical protein
MFVDIQSYIQSSTGSCAGSAYIYYVVPNGIQAIELKHRSGFAHPCLQEKATVFIGNTNVHQLCTCRHHGRGLLCVAWITTTDTTGSESSQCTPVLGIFYAAHTNGQVSYLPWLGLTKAINVTLGNQKDDQVAVPSFFDEQRDWKCIQKHFSPTLQVSYYTASYCDPTILVLVLIIVLSLFFRWQTQRMLFLSINVLGWVGYVRLNGRWSL